MFHELTQPIRALMSVKYYVRNMDEDVHLYLRNDGTGLGNGGGEFNQYLFTTKVEAHTAAMAYYNANKMLYPYGVDLVYASQNEVAALMHQNGAQQIMEFI